MKRTIVIAALIANLLISALTETAQPKMAPDALRSDAIVSSQSLAIVTVAVASGGDGPMYAAVPGIN